MKSNLLRSLIVVSIILAVTVFSSQVSAAGYATPELLVETGQLEQLLHESNVRIVDVRSTEAYEQGHIPNAVHLGADDIIDPGSHVEGELVPYEKLAPMLGQLGIGRDTKVIFYDDKGGFIAARLFWMLEYFGHRNLSLLNGGFPKWVKEGRKVTRAVPSISPAYFPLTLTPRKKASADWILDRQDDQEVRVIDVRPTKMYQDGHIPWAINIPWKQNLTPEETIKSADELSKHFEAHGVTKDRNVVVHCQIGKAAAHSYFTLRLLGYPRVRSYDRSWAEWGAADDLPKAGKKQG